MNTNDDADETSTTSTQPEGVPEQELTTQPSRHWMRSVLAGNPFYLLSAAMLLFGVNRLSVDPDFLGAEEAKLAFNFSALQLYELLLVLVGIILARRRIWYDSTLLIGLENMLVLVPFILVTQALLIGREVAAALCITGSLMAVLRVAGLKRFIPGLNMPPQLLGFGLIFLGVNLALPLGFRWLLADRAGDFWEEPNRWCWFIGLPLLQLLANGLRKPSHWGGIAPQRSWLPFGLLELWMGATAIHLWSIAYVAKVALEPYLLAPLLWALAWTVCNRLGDFSPNPSPTLRKGLLFAPALLTVLGAFHETSYVFLILTLLNALIYGRLYAVNPGNRIAFQLLVVSFAGVMAGFPSDWGQSFVPDFNRAHCVALAVGAYLVWQAFRSRRPQAGACGAIGAALAPGFFDLNPLFHIAAQAGLVFLLLHSMRWIDKEHRGAATLRTLAAAAWMAHGILFTLADVTQAKWFVSGAALLVLAACVTARLFTGNWGPVILPVAAMVSMLAAPSSYLLRKAMTSPSGLLAIVASFLLFGLGTLLALTKHRWHGSTRSPDAATMEDGA